MCLCCPYAGIVMLAGRSFFAKVERNKANGQTKKYENSQMYEAKHRYVLEACVCAKTEKGQNHNVYKQSLKQQRKEALVITRWKAFRGHTFFSSEFAQLA